jgi:hypothetical protein
VKGEGGGLALRHGGRRFGPKGAKGGLANGGSGPMPRLMQCVAKGANEKPADEACIPEAHFRFRWMDVHVDALRLDFDKKGQHW